MRKTARKPSTRASEATRIATLSAMPRAVMNVVAFLTAKFRMLYEIGIAIFHPLKPSASTIAVRAALKPGSTELARPIIRAIASVSSAVSGLRLNP